MSADRPSGSVRYDNSGRIVVVTGGVGGIGRAICNAFATSGSKVICADIDQQAANELPEAIVFQRCDTSSETDCRNTIKWVVDQLGGIDVLINNAAIQPRDSYRPQHEMSAEVLDRMVAINFAGYAMMAKYALQVMKRQHSGVLVNIASGQAHRTAREVGVYGPIKSANVMQARQWGVEYARDGIRVVSISPGAIDTPLVRQSLEAQGGEAQLANRHPLGRLGQPHEVAAAVLWLTSSDASFVTATDLEVDGGLGAFGAFAEPFAINADC